jgi:hypothetical protein
MIFKSFAEALSKKEDEYNKRRKKQGHISSVSIF